MRTLRARVTSCASGLWHIYRNWRYAILFYSLLLTLAVAPLRRALGFPASFLELFLAINLLAAVVPIGGRKTRWVLLFFLVVAFVGRGGTAWLDLAALGPMSLALWTVVALLAAASALRFALGARVVDREHLYAGAQRLPARRGFLWGLLLGPRAHLVRLVCRTRRGGPGQFFTRSGDLLQLRDAHDAGLRRYCPP